MKNTYSASTNTDSLVIQLLSYGIDYQEAMVYVYLLEHGMNTVWDISRSLEIPRTTIYRCVETLQKRGFVVETLVAKSKKYFALGIEAIEKYINDYEQNLASLKKKTGDINDTILQIRNQKSTNYKVLHYQGIEGLKQVNWNSTKAEGELRIIEVNTLTQTVDQEYAENIRKIFGDKGTIIKQLTNQTSFEDFTRHPKTVKNWQVKHLPPEVLDIKAEIQIYNDVTCMYEYVDDNIFIIEIINQTLTDMHRQIFEYYWKNAMPMEIISPYGATRLVNNK